MTPAGGFGRLGSGPIGVALAVGAVACADGESGLSGTVVRDSAGIRIVQNDHTQPAWSPGAAWRLSEEPVVRIGSMDGEGGDILHLINDARILADGRIAVVVSGSHEVRIFDPTGHLLGTVGREGEGPGEFSYPRAVFEAPGDSLLVAQHRRVSVFGPDLTYARLFFPDEGAGMLPGLLPLDQFGDGSLLFRAMYQDDPERRGLGRNRIRMLRGYIDGSVESLGEFDDQTIVYGSNQAYLFGAWAWQAASDSTMWYGPGDVLEFREIGLDGALKQLVRLDRPSRPVLPSDVDAFVEAQFGRLEGRPQASILRQRYEEPTHPDSFPAHFLMETDDAGNLWVQDYRPWGSEDHMDRVWTVFDPEGRYLGDVTVPAGLRVFTIHADRLVGVWYNDLGVEFVHVYAIEKPH